MSWNVVRSRSLEGSGVMVSLKSSKFWMRFRTNDVVRSYLIKDHIGLKFLAQILYVQSCLQYAHKKL